MRSVFFAEFAVFIDFDTIGIVLFVFVGLVVSLFAFSACQSNQSTHLVTPRLCYKIDQSQIVANIEYHSYPLVSTETLIISIFFKQQARPVF